MFYSKNLVNYQFSFVFFVIGILILRCIFYFWIIEQFRDDHIFILRAFYYTQSRLFGSESKSNIVVILVNLERRLFVKQINPECIYQGRHSASLESVHEGYPHAPCRLGIFRIVCRLPLGAEPSRSIGISLRGSAPINIPLTPSDTTSRQLIICPGRMFLFEQWHLFLATMEANKLLGAQLIIAHIQSIIQTLIPLLKIYENEGILQIRPSLRMPSKQNLLFDPNEETLWNNQLNNFHECLYEFKESTEFIGFPDWDDILLASGAIPFTDQLKHFSIANPHIAAFLPKRYPGQIDNLETLFNKTIISPIEHLFFDSIKFSIWPEDNEFISKIFLRPNLVDSVDLHGAGHIIENFIQEELPENIAFFVHARDFKNIQLTTILPQALLLTSNTLLTLQHHNISSFSSSLLLKRLPKKEKYLNLLNTCLKKKNIEGRVRTQKRSKCFNYAQCKPEIKLEIEDYCLNTDNQWGEIYLPNRQLSAFVLFESRLKVMKLCQI